MSCLSISIIKMTDREAGPQEGIVWRVLEAGTISNTALPPAQSLFQ
jgi:hypothetical protein